LQSQLYQFIDGKLEIIEQFSTHGGTDVAVYPDGDDTLVAVSNSLTSDIRFTTESVIYTFKG